MSTARNATMSLPEFHAAVVKIAAQRRAGLVTGDAASARIRQLRRRVYRGCAR